MNSKTFGIEFYPLQIYSQTSHYNDYLILHRLKIFNTFSILSVYISKSSQKLVECECICMYIFMHVYCIDSLLVSVRYMFLLL